MAKDYIGYETLIDAGMRSVVREALRNVQKRGLVGSHHFFITFRTQHPGVEMPEFLRERYPDEITIVMQNQFSGLHIDDDAFDITLSFQKIPASLHVPFAALTQFADPGVQFGLQFKGSPAKGTAAALATTKPAAAPAKIAPKKSAGPVVESKPASESQVVSLEKFRKK